MIIKNNKEFINLSHYVEQIVKDVLIIFYQRTMLNNFFQKRIDKRQKILYTFLCSIKAPLAQLVRATGS